MNNKTPNVPVKPELLEGIKDLCTSNREIILISLCTTDGFNIKSFAAKTLSAEADKVAAMASSLNALSNSSSKQVIEHEASITTIESNGGNLLFLSTNYLGFQCVLTVAATLKMSLGTARYTTKRLAKLIESIET